MIMTCECAKVFQTKKRSQLTSRFKRVVSNEWELLRGRSWVMPFKCLMERERTTLRIRTYGTREIFSARAEPLGVKIVPKHSKRCALLILTVHNKPRRRLGFLKSFYFLFFSFLFFLDVYELVHGQNIMSRRSSCGLVSSL